MNEEDSSHETKKGKKKEDWAEVEIEIGDIEFEAKGRSVVVERMFRLLLEKIEAGKLVKTFKLAEDEDEEEEEEESEEIEEVVDEDTTESVPEETPEEVFEDSSPAEVEDRIPSEAYLDPPPAWDTLDSESPPESEPEKNSRESPY